MAAFNPCLPVLVVGGSGSGKTYSIKGFAGCPSAVGVLSVEKGRLPFRSGIKTVKVPEAFQGVTTAAALHKAKYGWVEHVITASRPGMSLVVDDSQYLLANELFDRAQERGYDKFLDMASNFRHLVHYINTLDGGKIVYFLHHEETDADGRAKAKTIGRMLDEKLVLEGCFDVVLYCRDHKFFTQGNGVSTAKSPEGMFDEIEIENNLKIVDDAIRAYYGMPSIRTEEHN